MSVDAELTLDMMRVQLYWLEREMTTLRRLIEQIEASHTIEPFERLAGVWQGNVFSEDDFDASRLMIPEDL
jgi:hypothetical protein